MALCEENSKYTDRRIASFVVLDLETNDLPYSFSKIAITELCMYGFAANELETAPLTRENNTDKSCVPQRPRNLHKLTLLFNPRRAIHPNAEEITGLNNYSLENESHFDENAGRTILNFLKHMQQPVCLVAHNGDMFDFPIVKQTFNKIQLELPSDTLCVDSLRAFWSIDEQLKSMPTQLIEIEPPLPDTANPQEITESKLTLAEQLDAEGKINWQALNETTPRRQKGIKRKHCDDTTPQKATSGVKLKSRRTLFACKQDGKYPPKGVYKLGKMYERIFKETPEEEHYAEADVKSLMRLMLAYGQDFLAYTENYAIPFREICVKR